MIIKSINYKLKIIAIISFTLIIISSSISYLNPVKGYELSIYESTPIFVWIFLIISIAGGLTIVLHQIYTEEYKSSNFWLIGFFVLILNRVTLLYVPYIRGYYTWNGDNISHLGIVKSILYTGYVPNDIFYPITHILLSILISISGIPIEFIVNHSTGLLSILYVVSIYLLATVVLQSRDAQLLSAAAIGGVLFNGYDVYIMPNGWSVLYLPFVFFFFFSILNANKVSIKYNLLLVILLILYPFFHPLSSSIIILLFINIGFSRIFLYIIEKKFHNLNRLLDFFPMNLIFIELIIFLSWIMTFQGFNANIINLYTSITKGHGPDAMAQMGEKLDKINIHGIDFLILIIKIMGDEIIFLILSVIAVIIIFKNKEDRKSNYNLIIILGIIFTIGIIYLVYFFNIIPGLGNIGSDRLLAYLVIFTPIPVGYVFKNLIRRKKYAGIIICLFILMIASTISMFSLYSSPYILRPNIQVTQMDINGMSWFFENKDRKISDTGIMSPSYRFADTILGYDEVKKRSDIKQSFQQISDHFNYSFNKYLGESYTENRYSVITMFDRTIYDTVWKIIGRFHKEDFENLEKDSSVDKLYSNGEVSAWYIHSIQ